MRHSKACALLPALIFACAFLLYSAYTNVKNETIDQLNSLQLTLAKQAAGSIESSFRHLAAGLEKLSRMDRIISLDDRGKELMQIFHEMHADDITAITRTDTRGHVIHTFPPNPELLTLEERRQIQEMMRTQRPVLSDVFTAMAGSKSIAFHVPVFDNGLYKGSLGVLIPFDRLARKHVEEIKIGDDGYAWVVTRKGVELYCPVPGHAGKSVFENCKGFPDILLMADEMVKGSRGITTYSFNRVRGETVELLKKHAVYLPVQLGNTFWSLVVATPESEVIASIQGFRDRWFLIAGIMLITIALSAYYLFRAYFIVREDLSRKRAELALKESEQLLHCIIQASPIPTFVIGKDHRLLHWNKALEELTWIKADEVLGTTEHWRAFYSDQRPCLADLVVDETPEVINHWYTEQCNISRLTADAYEATSFFPALGSGGKWLHFTVAAIRNSQGILVGAIESLEDITERKRSEDALEKAFVDLRELNFIVDKGPAIAFLWRASNSWPVEFVSNNIAQFGYTPDDFISGSVLFAHIIHPDDLNRVAAEVMQHTSEGVAEFTQEYRIICKSGEIRWIYDRTWVRRDKGRKVTHYQGIVFDITERRQAEEALISANRELNDIIEFLPDATVVIDKDKRIIAWNRAIEKMTGVGKEDVIGKPHSVCTVPFYGKSRLCLLDLLDPGDNQFGSEYRYIVREGNTIFTETYVPCVYEGRGAIVLATAASLFDIHGNRVGAIESIRDITESKKKEEALLESQQQLSDIINFLPDATLVIDKRGKVIAWNRAMEEMTGILAADMLGKENYEYALPFYGERRPILIDLVLRPQEEVEAEYDYVERKGTVIAGEAYMEALRGGEAYLFGKASALFDPKGTLVGAIESIRDVTERRRVEEALLRAEEKYRSIFENAMEGIYQSTLDGRFISVNPAFAHMLGYDSPEEVLHTITDIAHQLYVKPQQRVELLHLLAEQKMVHRFETRFFRKDGSIAWITLNIRAAHDKTAHDSYLEGTAEDVSDRKALESQLVQVQKMEAMGTLAGGIAHDFNNILAPIIGYSELALREIPADTRLYFNIEQVLRSGRRAKNLVRQILTFSRKTEQECMPVQVSLLVEETYQMLRSTLPSTIEIRPDIDGEAIYSTVSANPTQIHQVLMNLCTNAAHAMRENGGVLSISLTKADIDSALTEIPGLKDGSYLNLSVSDTGHGMSEEVRQRIFDPYFTTKGPDEGTGLGLAVVYGIVRGLSGGIMLSSAPGEGTTFQVFFPITETSEKASAIVSKRLPTGNGHILVIDDEKYVAEMLKEMIEQLGYEVTSRSSSADALGAFQAQPERFDLVITDQTMPHMTGIDLAKQMLKTRPDIPIILCTGFSTMIDGSIARKIGIKAFLMKPITLQQLAEEIHKQLNPV
ncbi:MAG: PAS domain S-box protein [Syntrophobacteraceae bacterium]